MSTETRCYEIALPNGEVFRAQLDRPPTQALARALGALGKAAADLHERFWSKVDKTPGQGPHGECWTWKGGLFSSGYGQFKMGGRPTLAHRTAWELTFGALSPDKILCHRCDYKPCVRLEHLFTGTPADNSTDMKEKGRASRGEKHPLSRVTADQVLEIRRRHAAGESIADLAREHSFTWEGIKSIITRKSWGWLQ